MFFYFPFLILPVLFYRLVSHRQQTYRIRVLEPAIFFQQQYWGTTVGESTPM